MTARRAPAARLCLRIGSRHEVAFVPFPAKAPMFVIGAASTLVTFTLPEHLNAGHVDFARQLAAKAWAYSVAVERRYRGLPPLPDMPVPFTLTARSENFLRGNPNLDDTIKRLQAYEKAGADVLFSATTPKQAAQAIKKVAEIG